jgi:hypothetical protein
MSTSVDNEDIKIEEPINVPPSNGVNEENTVADEDELGKEIPWQEAMMNFFHRTEHGVELYCNNTCTNWGYICGAIWLLYLFLSFAFWGLLEAAIAWGNPLLWAYFACFWIFVLVLGGMVMVGSLERRKQEELERRQRAGEL